MYTVYKNLNAVLKHLRIIRLSILLQVEAEEVPDVTDRYGVTVVPYFLIVKVLVPSALLIHLLKASSQPFVTET